MHIITYCIYSKSASIRLSKHMFSYPNFGYPKLGNSWYPKLGTMQYSINIKYDHKLVNQCNDSIARKES